MTMEEHCPHGNRNAVFCSECEREDRARIDAQYERRKKEERRRKEFMELCRGLPARTVAKILAEHGVGVDYRGCSKNEMADIWVGGAAYGHKLSGRDKLRQKLRRHPRETAEEKATRKQAREHRRRAQTLVTYLEERTPDRLEEALGVIREKDLPEEVLVMAFEALKKKETGYERQVASNTRWLKVARAAREALESVVGETGKKDS